MSMMIGNKFCHLCNLSLSSFNSSSRRVTHTAQATGGCKHRIIYNSMVASDYSKLLEVATPSKYSYTNPITKVYHTFWRTFKNYSTVFFALTGNHRQNLEPIPSYTKEIRAISTPKSKVSFQPLHYHDWPKFFEKETGSVIHILGELRTNFCLVTRVTEQTLVWGYRNDRTNSM